MLYQAEVDRPVFVSMESGLEGRNNSPKGRITKALPKVVSMESGLEGRNNCQTCDMVRSMRGIGSQWSPA